jgi:hypothetical protein
MKKKNVLWRVLLCLVILPSFCLAASAQVSGYIAAAGEEALVLNGKAEAVYATTISGHPYMDTEDFRTATLSYNGKMYPDVLLRLNTQTDELSIQHGDGRMAVVLEPSLVDFARTADYTWLRDTAGYYALLHDGKYPVIKRERKILEEEIEGMTVRRYFSDRVRYFVDVNGKQRQVKSRNSVVKLFPDRKKELKQYAKQEKLDFKRNADKAIVTLIRYYESIQ